MHDTKINWQLTEVTSPHLDHPVPTIAAKNIPYIPNGNRLQNLSIYLRQTHETLKLTDKPATSLPAPDSQSVLPRWHVHIHGGAWRDPQLTSKSIEAAIAHAFSTTASPRITAIASINYTLSPFPTHPTLPYDPTKGNHSDPSREAEHPAHVRDVLEAFTHLRSFGLTDGSYILTGHSAGACLASQATLQPPQHWGLESLAAPPCPAALVGLNGLYDLPELVNGLGASHEHLRDVYRELLGHAFGEDQSRWPAASPARVDVGRLAGRIRDGEAPRLVVLDQSTEDQLVPMNQTERLEAQLSKVDRLRVVRGHRCTGKHAAPWEEGIMIWESMQDVLKLLDT